MALIAEANLTSLPLELKVKIFRMMTEYNDAWSLTQVNQEWQNIGEDPRNWMLTEEMTFFSMPWKSVEVCLSKPERTRYLRSGKIVEGNEKIRYIRFVKFEDMICDGHGERILKKLADYGQISRITLSRCLLFNISLSTEEKLKKSKIKQLIINNCTAKITKDEICLMGGVYISQDEGKTANINRRRIYRLNTRNKKLAIEGCWVDDSKFKYEFHMDCRRHLTISTPKYAAM